jgi:hypothetical protein
MKKLLSIALLGSCLTAATASFSAEVDFKGNFLHDNDVLRFDFSAGLPNTDVTIFSSSWIDRGPDRGFDPILAIWDSAGNQIEEQDDGGVAGSQLSNTVSYNYGEFDSFLTINLAAGDYIATLAQYDNFSVSTLLADGFLRDADPLFTAVFGCSNGSFCTGSLVDSNGDLVEPNRTSDWALHFLNVADAQLNTVPEPSALILFGLAGLALTGRRKDKIYM